MRVVVATSGSTVAAELPTPEAGAHLLSELADVSRREVLAYGLPPSYRAAVYRREFRSPEVWQSAAVTASRRIGDCEDLVAYRVGALWATGIDPRAYPALVQRGAGLWHAVVVRGSGMVEDPSAVLGMVPKGAQLACREVPGGWQARIVVPCGPRSHARAYGSGQTPLDAVCEAAAELASGLEAYRVPTAPADETAEVAGVPMLPMRAGRDLELVVSVVDAYARGRLSEARALLDGGTRIGASAELVAALRRAAAASGC